jgi:hypothetical protein
MKRNTNKKIKELAKGIKKPEKFKKSRRKAWVYIYIACL